MGSRSGRFKYRFYPTPEQADQLNRTFGCVRLVYNRALDARTRTYTTERRSMTYVETSTALTEWKCTDELAFLNEVSSVPLQQALRHLQVAFAAFWDKRSRYPRFKSKRKSRASAEYTRSAFRWRGGQLTLAKMNAPLAIVWSRPLPDGVVALSTGEKITNPRHERADRRKLAKSQRKLARKDKVSANRGKARVKVARIHARIADRRRDHLHKLTTRLVRENQTVVIEDLSVRNMLRNHNLARAISDAAWSELRGMLEYKAQWYGRAAVAVDRWFPSSKTCSTCRRINPTMPLRVRSWTCPACGADHDRDVKESVRSWSRMSAGLSATLRRCPMIMVQARVSPARPRIIWPATVSTEAMIGSSGSANSRMCSEPRVPRW
ncbi:putative transposase [Micromonospora cremea]|uniref:Putative transposase n=1 Tax=Micromonospora cremea TaxID=709881 RepID=A0A1N6AUF1_9ACTN|nr:putative transposase [Micromonospora cremea]